MTERPQSRQTPDMDPFHAFRYALATFVTVYATVVTLQVAWEWYAWLMGRDRYMGMVRRYVVVHGLRLRLTAFWGDALVCALLGVAFVLAWRLTLMAEAGTL